jgi:outer membrane protein
MSRLITALLIVLATQGFAQEEWSLQRCIGYALENNIQVKQSEVSVNISEQNYNQSRAAALPTLNGFASHGYNWGQRIDPFTNQFATQRVRNNTFAVNSSITLFGGFTTINNIRKSKFDLLASKYNVDKMRNDIAMNLATTFLQVLFNEELLEISRKQVDASRLQLQRLESLEQQGQIARGQVLDMRAQLANDELNVVNRQNALDLSRLSLIQLMQLKGQDAANFRIARPDLSSIEPTELQNLPDVQRLHNLPSHPMY